MKCTVIIIQQFILYNLSWTSCFTKYGSSLLGCHTGFPDLLFTNCTGMLVTQHMTLHQIKLNYQMVIKSGEGVIELLPHPNNGVRISKFGLGSSGVWTRCQLPVIWDTRRKRLELHVTLIVIII